MSPALHPWTVTLRTEARIPIDLWTAAAYAAIFVLALLATRRRPGYGIAVLVAAVPFALTRYVGPTTLTLLKAALAGFALGLATSRPLWAELRTRPVQRILGALALSAAAIVLSFIHAENRGDVARELLKLIEYAAIFGAASLAFATDPDERTVWRTLEAVTAIVCLSAVAQYVVGANAGIFVHGQSIPRIAGLLDGPNQLSGFLGLVLPVLWARNLLHRDARLAALIGFAALADLLTFSRAGIVGAFLACGVVFVVMRPPRKVGVRVVAASVIVMVLAGAAALRAGFSGDYFSLNPVPQPADHLGNRAILWNAALTLWRRSPIVGVGAGNFEDDLAEAGAPGVRTHANSWYLQSLAEGGIVMFGATLVTLGTVLVTLGRSGIRPPLVVGTYAATIGFAAHQLFDDLVFFPKVGGMWWLLVGLAAGEIARRSLVEQRRVHAVAA